jgi:hypothetical protein
MSIRRRDILDEQVWKITQTEIAFVHLMCIVFLVPLITTVAGAGTGGSSMSAPVDLFLNSNGTLYEAEWNGRVQAFSPNRTTPILSQSRIGSIRGICVDNAFSNYYVTADGNVTMWPANISISHVNIFCIETRLNRG